MSTDGRESLIGARLVDIDGITQICVCNFNAKSDRT